MTPRRLLPLLAVLVLAATGLSGCVAIQSESSGAPAPGVVTLNVSICAAQHTNGSPCQPGVNTAENDNGNDAAVGTPQNPINGQMVVGFRVPAGTVTPDSFTSTTAQSYTRSPAYTSALNSQIPPPTGFIWVGYVSSGVTLTTGAPLTSISPQFGLPAAADGTPFTGPFLWRAIVGAIGVGGDASSCTAQTCLDSPQPANLGNHFQQIISDFRVMPATPPSNPVVAPGQTATASFNVRYIDNAAFGARTFDLTASTSGSCTGCSPLPGNPKVTPSATSLTNFLNNQTRPVTASVTVPAGTPPGVYGVTLQAADHASGVLRSSTATVTVVDKTAPTISIGSPTDGQVVTQGQQIAAVYSCADEAGGSGLATCAGPVANGAPIDTSTVGQKTFTVTATDKAGNQASLTHTYTVNAPVVISSGRKTINISLSFLFAAGRKSTKFTALTVKGVPSGSTVAVKCSGHGCPKKTFTKKRAKGSVSLSPYVKKALPKGLKLTIAVSKPGFVSMIKTVVIESKKAPKITTTCLAPGAKKASSCS